MNFLLGETELDDKPTGGKGFKANQANPLWERIYE
jgi:hypothetical protein